jgi:hypothetical protein
MVTVPTAIAVGVLALIGLIDLLNVAVAVGRPRLTPTPTGLPPGGSVSGRPADV